MNKLLIFYIALWRYPPWRDDSKWSEPFLQAGSEAVKFR